MPVRATLFTSSPTDSFSRAHDAFVLTTRNRLEMFAPMSADMVTELSFEPVQFSWRALRYAAKRKTDLLMQLLTLA